MPPVPVQPPQAIEFFNLVQTLKARLASDSSLHSSCCTHHTHPCNVQLTKRTGWVRSAVKSPESIADHMYRMAVMAMLAPSHLNRDRYPSAYL